MPPPEFAGRFGARLRNPLDYEFLLDYTAINKGARPQRDILMARDSYDDCIAYLDEQLGRLLRDLDRLGLLAETEVIITADHGEGFGDHGYLGHSYSQFLDEIGVPLVMLSPDAPARRQVYHPVSLRDIPATVVDRLGLAANSPFPGRSVAAYWNAPAGEDPGQLTSPAFSEQASRVTTGPAPGPGGFLPGFQMSIISSSHHYIRDGLGHERLYFLGTDPYELRDMLLAEPRLNLRPYRQELLKVLVENPGSREVERAYLADYRRTLRSLVDDRPSRGTPPVDAPSTISPNPNLQSGRRHDPGRDPRSNGGRPGSPTHGAG